MQLAVIGATGLVGRTILQVLEERKFPVSQLIPVGSEKSVGTTITFQEKEYPVLSLNKALQKDIDLAIFSAGAAVSLEWAPQFAAKDCTVIDNSSAWRMDPSKKLIVPEINAKILTANDKIIASPNCSSIQLALALAPLHEKYSINRIVISTYQSVTGTGKKAIRQLQNECQGNYEYQVYPHPIHQNALPQCDSFLENGYTKEEIKLMEEPKKILNDNSIKSTATAVRVPVMGGHAESVNIQFKKDYELEELRNILNKAPGLIVQDLPEKNHYPTPLSVQGKNEVFVGRIRRDDSQERSLNLWIVADNLRKGAATNTVQIAEYLCENALIPIKSI